MSLFRMPRFFRRFIRRKMHPMSKKHAMDKKQVWSLWYLFFAWNAGGYVMYQVFVKKNKYHTIPEGMTQQEFEQMSPALWYAHSLQIPKSEVYRISGTHVSRSTINANLEEGIRPSDITKHVDS